MALDRKELDQILSTLNKYAEKKLTPEFLLKLDHEDRFPSEVLADLYNNIGLHLVFIDEEDDGLGGGAYDVYRVSEAMAGIDVGIATGVLATFLGADPIVVGGTPEQK
ncbi:MAG: acyl-CoA dehydrogenase family protein, partial [Caldilinea sp.]